LIFYLLVLLNSAHSLVSQLPKKLYLIISIMSRTKKENKIFVYI